MNNHTTIKRAERSLHRSTVEGMAFGGVQGSGEHFVAAYGVALGASNSQIALLSSLPNLLGAAAQSTSARMSRLLGGRKRVVVLFALLSGLLWVPITGVGLLKPGNPGFWLVLFAMLYTASNAIIGPAWSSIMAEVVPGRLRGRYFGQRTRWSTLANVAVFVTCGGLMFALRDRGLTGFVIVFMTALAFRLVSLALLATLVELPHNVKDDERPSMARMTRSLFTTNLGRLMLYLFALNFAVNLAGPFFTPYMLRTLGVSYLTFTMLEMMTILASLWAVTHWGAAADRTGNRSMLTITGVLVSFVPVLWLVSGNVFYLAAIQFYSGIAWAGFNLVSSNFLFDATTSQNRTAYLAYFGAGAALASALGAFAGGALVDRVPALLGSSLLTMFLISSVLRLMTGIVFLPGLREVRRVRKTGAAELFHIVIGGRSVHRPASHGRAHVHLHSHREGHDEEPAPTITTTPTPQREPEPARRR